LSKILKSESFSVQMETKDDAVLMAQSGTQEPKDQIIEQALRKSKLICLEAQKRAAALIESAKEDCLHIRIEAEQRGYREGYARGVLDGALEARRSSEEGLQDMHNLLEAIKSEKRNIAVENKKDIIDIAFTIAQKIMRQHIDANEDAIGEMIRNIIHEHESGVRIYLSEYSATLEATIDRDIAKRLSDRSSGTKVIVTNHEDLLMVDTDEGVTDMSIPTQLSKLREVLDSEKDSI